MRAFKLENGNIKVILDQTDDPHLIGPTFFEMTPEEFKNIYGDQEVT